MLFRSPGANPCESCGACCAQFRVSFYWSESDAHPGGRVPASLTVPAVRPWDALQKAIDDGNQPAQLRAELERLMDAVDEETRAKVKPWLATVGDNTAALAEGIDKLRSKLRMEGAAGAGGDA